MWTMKQTNKNKTTLKHVKPSGYVAGRWMLAEANPGLIIAALHA